MKIQSLLLKFIIYRSVNEKEYIKKNYLKRINTLRHVFVNSYMVADKINK